MEDIIAYHCAPALAGIKPANIVNCQKNKISDIYARLENLSEELAQKGIFIEVLCDRDDALLLMVYRKKVLQSVLQNDDVRTFLASYGYKGDVKEHLSLLKKRLKRSNFPHEIGAFLGYPLHDIRGFIEHKDEGCVLYGEWRVYEKAEEARKLFYRFNACRKALSRRIMSGQTLSEVFCN